MFSLLNDLYSKDNLKELDIKYVYRKNENIPYLNKTYTVLNIIPHDDSFEISFSNTFNVKSLYSLYFKHILTESEIEKFTNNYLSRESRAKKYNNGNIIVNTPFVHFGGKRHDINILQSL
jgi:hypothetical protein